MHKKLMPCGKKYKNNLERSLQMPLKTFVERGDSGFPVSLDILH